MSLQGVPAMPSGYVAPGAMVPAVYSVATPGSTPPGVHAVAGPMSTTVHSLEMVRTTQSPPQSAAMANVSPQLMQKEINDLIRQNVGITEQASFELTHQRDQFRQAAKHFEQEARVASADEVALTKATLGCEYQQSLNAIRHTEQLHFEGQKQRLEEEAEQAVEASKRQVYFEAQQHLSAEQAQFAEQFAQTEKSLSDAQTAAYHFESQYLQQGQTANEVVEQLRSELATATSNLDQAKQYYTSNQADQAQRLQQYEQSLSQSNQKADTLRSEFVSELAEAKTQYDKMSSSSSRAPRTCTTPTPACGCPR